ncbi:MAG: asparaginase [Burkholderiaceae bacterium]|jgi:L-asparaginase|nr:asparaginase [Burkholderiaceae bacterium]
MPRPTPTRPPALAILTTGGTFEKRYLDALGELGFAGSCLETLTRNARLANRPRIEQVMLLDSLLMGDKEREVIVKRILKAKERHLVIVHGTDTMTSTALAIKTSLDKQLKKTVVLTGAMVPVAHQDSDGFFNLGLAVAACQLAKPGVYIAMSGRIYEAGSVKKDRRKKLFLPTTSPYPGPSAKS